MSQKQKQGILLFFPILILLLCAIFISSLCLNTYQKIAFTHISAFCETAVENNPQLEPQLLAAAKEYHALSFQEAEESRYLEQYGYRPSEFCQGLSLNIGLLAFLFFLLAACPFLLAARALEKRNQKRILELTGYLEQVNKNAGGTVIQAEEDAFSPLQDEIYKTVTALFQSREAAIAARKRFAENLANIAHQLKTPITAAFLSLQLMKDTAPGDYTAPVKKQLKRLNRLEESLLLLSRIDAGTLPLGRAPVDIYTALTLAEENLTELLQKKKVSVEIPDRGCVEFSGDLEWTMEAFLNLLKNCMEHSPQGECIHCDYRETPIYKEILIWDEGAGFAPEDLPHLFERFYRGKYASSEGIGIGLALARSIFELQNGTITARNLPEGGACFEIRLYSH